MVEVAEKIKEKETNVREFDMIEKVLHETLKKRKKKLVSIWSRKQTSGGKS